MAKPIPIFYNALLLTAVNLLLRLVGTGFQVYISRRMGSAGVGLLQLTMSVGSFALVAGMAGVRTATMYITAGALGRREKGQVPWILSGCFRYSLIFSCAAGMLLYTFAPNIAARWIQDGRIVNSLRLIALFLPVVCLNGVMTGYFTAACRIRTLAAVEVAEQMLTMAVTMALLNFWAGEHIVRACESVILGSSAGSCLTLLCLTALRLAEKDKPGHPRPMARALVDTAVPLGAADVLKTGINTVENLMVPRRLSLCSRIANPLAAFGVLSGMVFPVLMFPACILFGLCELLIPELSRCAAAGSQVRIRYLARKGLRISLLYGALFSGGMFLLADWLCLRLYGSLEAAAQLKCYALLIPMLYADAITDAMTKGLGQQRKCVLYNILTAALDVVFLYLLLPRYGMAGYFLSFSVTHAINFCLSLRLLLSVTGQKLRPAIPVTALGCMVMAIGGAGFFADPLLRISAYPALLLSLWTLLGIVSKADTLWFKSLLHPKHFGIGKLSPTGSCGSNLHS